MTYFQAVESAQIKAKDHKITDKGTGKEYRHGDNPFYDMAIENACFCDMFPELVPDPENFHGFQRSNYTLHRPD